MSCSAKAPADNGQPGTLSITWSGTPTRRATRWVREPSRGPGRDRLQHRTRRNTGIKSWPDMREYTMSYHTGYAALGNGQAATRSRRTTSRPSTPTSRGCSSTASTPQPCNASKPTGGESPTRDAMAAKVRSAAESQGVKFYIMYDHQLDDHAQQNGKPVVTSPRLGDAQPSAGAVRQRGPARSPSDPGTGGGHGRFVMTLSRGAPSCAGARSRRSRRRRRGCRRRA